MDILEKAYDYIDYTLEELAKLEESCVSLMYFFKLFSPAGELAQRLLVDHSFIEVDGNNSMAVVGITERGRAVLRTGGIREYLHYLDMQGYKESRRQKLKRALISFSVIIAGSAVIIGYGIHAFRVRNALQ